MFSEGRDVFSELSALVDTLTTSGSSSLDQELFKQVKNICKSSDEHVQHLYRLVMSQLEKEHAEIRLSSFQIINEIFTRSHAFRVLLTDNLQEFFALTLGTNADMPLPEPGNVAKTLRNQSFQAVEKWNEKYGLYYKKLALGYKYLKNVKKIGFDGAQSNTAIERQRQQSELARQANHQEQRLNRVLNEMGETVNEIKSIIVQMGNCLQLILPSPEKFDIYKSTTDTQLDNNSINETRTSTIDFDRPSTSKALNMEPEKSSTSLKSSKSHKEATSFLKIAVSKSILITESIENTDILNTLTEQYKEISKKYLPLVQKWLNILTKQSGHNQNLVQAIDLKNSLTDLQQKFRNIKIIPSKTRGGKPSGENRNIDKENEDSEEEESFVEVPEKEGVEHISETVREEYGLSPLPDQNLKDTTTDHKDSAPKLGAMFWTPKGTPGNSAELADPSSRATALAAFASKQNLEDVKKLIPEGSHRFSQPSQGQAQGQSSKIGGKRAELLQRAPVVPFGMDLYHWGSKEEEAPSMSSLKSLHCFWVHGSEDSDDHCPGDIKESLKSRSIKFTGEFQGVKWACRAPLPSGKLCPRRDMYKCPFHGKIIPRDATGEPSEGPSREEALSDTHTSARETEQITKDIEAATGLNLIGSKSKKSKKRKHDSGLTDLKRKANTSRSRLEKKVFDKSSLERVAEEMGRVKKKLIDEKFGNNWNYSLSK